MKLLNISLKELIILIIFSVPIGAALFFHNFNKISMEYNFPSGYGYVENICSNDSHLYRVEILSDVDFLPLVNSDSTVAPYVAIEAKNALYKINLKGTHDQLEVMHQKIALIKTELNLLESDKFKNLLGKIRIHCRNESYKLYRYIPLNNEIALEKTVSRYKLGYMLFISICPFFILYLLVVSIKYINKNKY